MRSIISDTLIEMSLSLPERGVLKNNSRFMLLQEKYMARNTSNNNSDAAPGTNRNVNYMPMVLGNTGPVRGTRRLRYINERNLSKNNIRRSQNIISRRREKIRRRNNALRTLRAQRRVPVQSQLAVRAAAPAYRAPAAVAAAAPEYRAPAAAAYTYSHNNSGGNNYNGRYATIKSPNGNYQINTYDPGSFMYVSGAGSNTYEARQARAEAARQRNANEAYDKYLRDQELMQGYT